jgi:hypothetical protein
MALRTTDIAIVKIVILPTNIIKISVNLLINDKDVVIPVDNPTVPNAEMISKIISLKPNFGSDIERINVPKKIIVSENKTTA